MSNGPKPRNLSKSNHVTKPVLQSCSPLVLITDMGRVHDLSLVPELCSSSRASNSDRKIRSTSGLNTGLVTYSFALRLGPSTLPPLLLYERTLCRCRELLWLHPFIFPPTHYRLDPSYHCVQGALPARIGRSISQAHAPPRPTNCMICVVCMHC